MSRNNVRKDTKKMAQTSTGHLIFTDTFWTNPQFKITLMDSDPTDDEDVATVAIGLMQTGMRKKGGARFLTIGFCVYPVGTRF